MNHDRNPLPPEMDEQLKKMFPLEKDGLFGATGRYPMGKLSQTDEGEIIFGVAHTEGRVILDFGKPVHWVGMTPNQAIDLGNALLKHARKAK